VLCSSLLLFISWAIDAGVSVTAVDGSNATARIEILVRLAQINSLHGHAAIASQEITGEWRTEDHLCCVPPFSLLLFISWAIDAGVSVNAVDGSNAPARI